MSALPAREKRVAAPLMTPDGRYFVVRGRLWRATNPSLPTEVRELLVKKLMAARRGKGAAMSADNAQHRAAARQVVDDVKIKLGERGEVWWTDGTPDLNRHLVRNTPYAEWFAMQSVGTMNA
jgi:hypothetical protein